LQRCACPICPVTYLFVQGPPQLVRADIFNLALHLFNLLSLPLVLYMGAMGKAMDARNAKRVELTETVEVFKRQVAGLEGRLQGEANALT
jgi:hypothetical protein